MTEEDSIGENIGHGQNVGFQAKILLRTLTVIKITCKYRVGDETDAVGGLTLSVILFKK